MNPPDPSALVALWLFIMFMVGTPGPANMLIMAGGARYGFWRCMRFNAGLVTGKFLLNVAMAFGLLLLLADYPAVQTAFKYVSAGFMIYLALRSWRPIAAGETQDQSLRYAEGVLVHPLNPKAWVMSVLAWTDFGPALGDWAVQLLVIPASFAAVQIVFHSLWCFAGVVLQRALPDNVLLHRALVLLTVAVVLWAVLL